MSHSLVLESQTEIKPEIIKGLKTMLSAFGIKLTAQKTTKKKVKKPKTTWENCGAPLREPTPEEAKAIQDFIDNPQIATQEEVLEMEKELGIRLNFN